MPEDQNEYTKPTDAEGVESSGLLACPSCEGTPKEVKVADLAHKVWCPHCGASTNIYLEMDNAKKHWNERNDIDYRG